MSTVAHKQAAQNARSAPRYLGFALDADTETALQETFHALNLTFAEARRGSVKDARKHVVQVGSPALLVVDIDGMELPVSAIDELAEVCEPNVKVVVLGDNADIGLFRELIQLGVADYIVKPVTREHLQRAVDLALNGEKARGRQRLGRVVAVAGTRGGMGVSTIAASVGWTLAERLSRRVALIDLDVYTGCLDLLLNAKPSTGLLDALETPDKLDSAMIERAMSQAGDRLYLLGSEAPLGEDVAPPPNALQPLLALLRQRFHYVVLDVPHRPDGAFREILAHADIRVLVGDPSLPSVRDMLRLLKMLGEDDADHRTMVVLNHRHPPIRSDVSPASVEESLGRRISHTIPFGRDAVLGNDNTGEPAAARRCAAADALRRLADDISGRGQGQSRPGVLRRLLGRK